MTHGSGCGCLRHFQGCVRLGKLWKITGDRRGKGDAGGVKLIMSKEPRGF